ncbi:AAA family ATPase [Thermocrinis sp.]|uniref:AAA family ATPase n=1 Tax=Thermocrinis sp. TaxID=2024383 RepID=UPI002FDE20C7
MEMLKRLFGSKEKQRRETYEIQSSKGVLKLWVEEDLQRDPDTKVEEFWIETIGVSEDARWLLVGRRHGILQFYDWKGRFHRLPARPPAQVVSEILFKEGFLALLAPPYLVVYRIEDPENPTKWKSFKLSQENIRPSAGLDIRRGVLAFGVVGNKVYTIDVATDLSFQTVDFRSTFSCPEVGEIKGIKILPSMKIFVSGTEGCAIYSMGGNLLKNLPYKPERAISLFGSKLVLGEGNKIVVLDVNTEQEVLRLDTPIKVSALDGDEQETFLFLADAEENSLGIVDLSSGQYLQTLEGFGYSVVKVSKDGSVYTSRMINLKEGKLYQLVKLGSNLLDFIYPKDRQEKLIKQAEKLYKDFVSSVEKAKSLSQLDGLKGLRELYSVDIPLRRIRELILQGEEFLRKRRLDLFLEDMQQKLRKKELSKEDLKKVEDWLNSAEGKEEIEILTKVKDQINTSLKSMLLEGVEVLKRSLQEREGSDIETLESHQEVKDFRILLDKLPKELQLEGEKLLQKVLQEKIISYRLKRFRIENLKDKVLFGNEEFPKFDGQRRKLLWRLKTEEKLFINGKVFAKIVFEREDGIVLEPKRFSNLIPVEDLRSMPRWIRSYLRHLNGLFSHEFYRVPLFVSFEETPWFVQNLERFVSLIKDQLSFGEGILILEGDAGVGKNFLVEVFSALTNRPLYIVPCHSKMEKEDLTFTYEFDPKRGTKRVFSELVKALQTPGAVIYIDEINTLPPSLVKLFNPLFDYRRYLTLPTGEVIKARSDVILVGGMNPQHYLGVSELPQDVKSRADVMFVDYPPFEDQRGFFYPDEAIILKDYLSSLSDLNNEDFTYLWYAVVNGIETERGLELKTPKREQQVWLIFELLKITNAIRKAYRDYQSQKAEEPVEFVFSIRDTIRCARRLERYGSAKAAVIDTILPKVSSPLEREILRNIVESV